jgi:hypothetical protein
MYRRCAPVEIKHVPVAGGVAQVVPDLNLATGSPRLVMSDPVRVEDVAHLDLDGRGPARGANSDCA